MAIECSCTTFGRNWQGLAFAEHMEGCPMKDFRLVMGRVDHMMPHAPTEEMVALHNWHVYRGNLLYYTGTREECRAWIRMAERRKDLSNQQEAEQRGLTAL